MHLIIFKDFYSKIYNIRLTSISLPAVPLPFGIGRSQGIPFGDLGVNLSVRVTRAYRRLARPSSAPKPSYPPTGCGVEIAGFYRPENAVTCNHFTITFSYGSFIFLFLVSL